MSYPLARLRRLRKSKGLRRMISEIHLSCGDLIMPCFAIAGKNKREPIKSMPAIARLSVDNLIKEVKEIKSLGIPAILLFGIPRKKDEKAGEAYNEKGIVQQAIRNIKKEVPDMVIITDVCLCSYIPHGHCGIIRSQKTENRKQKNKKYLSSDICHLTSDFVDNDETIKLLAKTALSHAKAGADIVAPSAMMDGQVKAIREILDENNFSDTGIMSYSAKYASAFYGPFREVADSAPEFGDRKTYQMNPANVEEAMREVELDIEEGADIVMIKPALAYLDVIYRVKQRFGYPVAAYNVSGEYSMVKAASKNNWINEKEIVLEMLMSIKRAGANMIITYYAKEAAKWLRAKS